ncbi:hypothetical protein SV7mr_06530 [Stieleria bergensis]|uniref:Uncharacterized protein n=1 Tax=Stieleria bergensis TaxID=2528025 RepID=A0A517SPV7_9BACT|nr:hypothetical protein SV7mr_06530 [Planctomycetes bacterium SV_7m_r]
MKFHVENEPIRDVEQARASRPNGSMTTLCLCFGFVAIALNAVQVSAQNPLRQRTPDRGSYRVNHQEHQVAESLDSTGTAPGLIERVSEPVVKLVDHQVEINSATLTQAPLDSSQPPLPMPLTDPNHVASPSDSAAPASVVSSQPTASQHTLGCGCTKCKNTQYFTPEIVIADPSYDNSCDSFGCDSGGCDSMGCNGCWRCFVQPKKFFWSAELMLYFRKGSRLPPLVSTGALDDANTTILLGNEHWFREAQAGARITLGTWLDNCKDRHVVGRFWFSGDVSNGFSLNSGQQALIARPFFNVTDGETPAQDTLIVSETGLATGDITVIGDSRVFGGDISFRQLTYNQIGTVDWLYGYQFMRLDQSLHLNNRSISLDSSFADVGAVLETTDSFGVENEFHGAQFGAVTNYRQDHWSLSTMFKIAFGAVTRRANLRGETFISNGGVNVTDPNGLLVRSTNAGQHSDTTFGVVPELSLSVGWHRFPAVDVTFGYDLVVMTDALDVSGAIDPGLASNLADPAVGSQSPAFSFRSDTYYLQSIHFGLAYIY